MLAVLYVPPQRRAAPTPIFRYIIIVMNARRLAVLEEAGHERSA